MQHPLTYAHQEAEAQVPLLKILLICTGHPVHATELQGVRVLSLQVDQQEMEGEDLRRELVGQAYQNS